MKKSVGKIRFNVEVHSFRNRTSDRAQKATAKAVRSLTQIPYITRLIGDKYQITNRFQPLTEQVMGAGVVVTIRTIYCLGKICRRTHAI